MLEKILVVILIVLLVALFVISFLKKKKFNTELMTMRDELKVGDKVMTDSGVVGEVVEKFEEDEYKYLVLKTGKGEHTGFLTVHANAVYYAFDKEEKKNDKKVVVKVAPKTAENTTQEKSTEDKK
jgi:preprotein translocase YajC subunit